MVDNGTSKDDEKLPVQKRRFYRYISFWVIFLSVLYIGFLLGLSAFINHKPNQDKVRSYLSYKYGLRAEFSDLKVQLLTGQISGSDIDLASDNKKYSVHLKNFKISYNPWWILVGRLKLTSVDAQELSLDTSEMTLATGDDNKRPFPDFLKRIKLHHSLIENFTWKKSADTTLAVAKIEINSRFGSILISSPTAMTLTALAYKSGKFDLHADTIEQNGYFSFDLTKKRILDESRMKSDVKVSGLLLGLRKKYKHWLTDEGWDQDLEPVLSRFYGADIPKDRSYLWLDVASLSIDSMGRDLQIRSGEIRLDQGMLKFEAAIAGKNRTIDVMVSTPDPVKLSRLPLGQSKFRKSFQNITLELKGSGAFDTIENHDISFQLNVGLKGNLVNPEAGDLKAETTGRVKNRQIVVDKLIAALAGGSLNAAGSVDLAKKDLRVTFATKDFDLKTVLRMLSSINYPSLVNADGNISGPLNDPRFAINFTTDNAAYEFLNFGPATGRLSIANKNLDLSVNASGESSGKNSLVLKVINLYDSLNQNIELKSTHSAVAVKDLLKSKSMTGNIGGDFQLTKKGLETRASGSFEATDFHFYDHKIGGVKTKIALTNKHLVLSPLIIDLVDPETTLALDKGLVFDFTDAGYTLNGSIGNYFKISGEFKKSDRESINLKFGLNRFPLQLFSSLLPFRVRESLATGTVDLLYRLSQPIDSVMKSQFSLFDLVLTDGKFVLMKPTTFEYRSRAFYFNQAKFSFFDGDVTLDGALGVEGNSALKILGRLDFNGLAEINPVFIDAEKPVSVDVVLKGDIRKPQIFGKADLKNDGISFRRIPGDISGMNGMLYFEGMRLRSDNLTLNYDDAAVRAKGWIETDWQKLTGAQLDIVATDFPLRLDGNLDLVLDCTLALKGSSPIKLSGKANITDGEFKREFGITNFILEPQDSSGEDDDSDVAQSSFIPDELAYQIDVKNTGDFIVKNNIALIEMAADLKLIGSYGKPALDGQVDFTNGIINAFGVSFQQATGSALFTAKNGLNPVIDLTAKKDIEEYEIQAKILGTTDNLRLRLDSSPTLDRREILSMIFYGKPPDELTREVRQQFTQAIAFSQLAGILSSPVNKITGIDVFKVSSRQETVNDFVQRLSIGKQISNRFSLSFTTDLGTSNPERAVELEFQLFDNFYLVAAKDLGQNNRFRFNSNFRFEIE